ncbi:hypothetical protein E4T50_00732 [Aureobasidium sp. EXF-12298]|nr:hypothetical protein E4T50_00732 [Aureobasidium sp. EXF-12298]KAI4757663.1 hypothetical protein E4T51_09276 [Aureobasidium sp. EXF-12344]KAI4774812.1 hypothetical protein E4T52_10229 [Aureobasidium sp. EXF-3400]
MAEHSSSVYNSRLFTFRASENGAATTVHSGAVAAVSAPLKLLMEEEGPDGPRTSATLHSVREEDLLRFCDFCYTSTYTDPYPIIVKPPTLTIGSGTSNGDANGEGANTSTALVTTDDTTIQPPAAKRPRTESSAHSLSGFGRPGILGASPAPEVNTALNVNNKPKLHGVFAGTPYTTSAPRVFGTSTRTKSNGVSSNENHANVFIAHAAMHALAVNYDIAKLKTLSLQKLCDKLTRFECKSERVGDVLALVRWVYTTESGMARDMPELKDIVVRYVVSEVSGFGNSEEFRSLLTEGGGFVKDFWAMVYSNLL